MSQKMTDDMLVKFRLISAWMRFNDYPIQITLVVGDQSEINRYRK